MKTNRTAKSLSAWICLVTLCLSTGLVNAEQFGLFTYSVKNDTTVLIGDYPENAVGPVEIPAMIDGKPVTIIGFGAFSACTGLTSVSIPDSVTRIDTDAFRDCTGLTSVTIPGSVTAIGDEAFRGCTGLTSVSIPEGVTEIGEDAFWGCSGLTSITIPNSVTYIGEYSFSGCSRLRSITIPSNVAVLRSGAFANCATLTSAVFLGDAPRPEGGTFGGAPGFTIYYLSGSTGFTSPTWSGYPAVMIDAPPSPSKTWLLSHGYPYETDLNDDTVGPGVSLLMAYALDLDPNKNPSGGLPAPLLTPDAVTIDFHGTSPGVAYAAQTSTDLKTWTIDGVTITDPDPDGRVTASVARGDGKAYLRLVVSD